MPRCGASLLDVCGLVLRQAGGQHAYATQACDSQVYSFVFSHVATKLVTKRRMVAIHTLFLYYIWALK